MPKEPEEIQDEIQPPAPVTKRKTSAAIVDDDAERERRISKLEKSEQYFKDALEKVTGELDFLKNGNPAPKNNPPKDEPAKNSNPVVAVLQSIGILEK